MVYLDFIRFLNFCMIFIYGEWRMFIKYIEIEFFLDFGVEVQSRLI